jgi:hypothetical protein
MPAASISGVIRTPFGVVICTLVRPFADLDGVELVGSPADFSKLPVGATEGWGKVIRAANIKSD